MRDIFATAGESEHLSASPDFLPRKKLPTEIVQSYEVSLPVLTIKKFPPGRLFSRAISQRDTGSEDSTRLYNRLMSVTRSDDELMNIHQRKLQFMSPPTTRHAYAP